MNIRRATAADLPAVIEVERQSAMASHWSGGQYQALFSKTGDQSTPEHLALVAENDNTRPGPASGAPAIVAFLVARRIEKEWELENIAVAPAVLRRGIGTRLLRDLASRVRKSNGSAIFLEVRASNASARGLYKKLGFEESGLRKGYYVNPPEDAILCKLSFLKPFS